MSVIFHILINALAVVITSKLLPGVYIDSIQTAIIVAIVIAVLNWTVKPILLFLTFPITIVTLGLFTFVINTVIILLASNLVSGFSLSSFFTAFLFSIILSLVSSLLQGLVDGS